jgi:hypothetical protein
MLKGGGGEEGVRLSGLKKKEEREGKGGVNGDAHPLALELDVPESDTGVASERPVEREAV